MKKSELKAKIASLEARLALLEWEISKPVPPPPPEWWQRTPLEWWTQLLP